MDHGYGDWPTIQALRNPTRTAFVDATSGAATTYAQFEERTNRLTDALSMRGVRQATASPS